MNCEKLRNNLYQTDKNARIFTAETFSRSKEYLKESLEKIPLDYTILELRNNIMGLGVSRAVPSHHHEIPGKTAAEVAAINRQIDLNIESIYEAASEYKFCFLESFIEDKDYKTDAKLMEFYQYSVPNMLEILKEIRVMEENNAEILPKIDQIERCLKEGKYWDAVDITDEVYNHYIVPGDNLKEGYRYELPTKAYNLYGVQNGHLIATINILDVALKLEWIISQLKEQGYVFKRPWDRYLPRIIEGLRRFEIKAFDHFDLCIVGSYALQDEFDDDTTEAVRDAWQKVVDSMESVECYTKRNYPYPLLKRPRPGRSFYPLPEPSAYINRK